MNFKISKQSKRIVWKDFFIRVLIPSSLAIVLYIFAEYLFVIPSIEEHTVEQRQEMLQELTNSAVGVVEYYHKKEIDKEFTREEAQLRAIESIKILRYGKENNGYFWINNMEPAMLMHPLFPDINYFDVSNVEDFNGNKVFINIIDIVKVKGEGYITYKWQWDNKDGKPFEKLSYFKKFDPWGWVIGTGIYVEDLKAIVFDIKSKVLIMSGFVITAILIMLYIIITFNIKTVRNKYAIEEQLVKSIDAVKESEARFKALHNASFGGIAIHYKGIILDCNQGLSDLTGYTIKELTGMNGLLLFSESCRNIVKKHIESEFKEPYEVKGLKKGNTEYDLRIDAKDIPYNGVMARVVEFRDISNKKLAERKMQQLSTAVEQSANIVIITDAEGNIEYVNPKFTELTGFSSKEIIGKNPRVFKSEGTSKATYKTLWDTIKSGKTWKGGFKNLDKNGNTYYDSTVITPIKNNSGDIVNFLAIKEDITEEKRQKEQLIQSEKRFKLLSESTYEAIFISQLGIIIDVNNSAMELTQLSYNELFQTNPLDFIDEADREAAYHKFMDDNIDTFETIGVRKDGTKVDVEVRTRNIKINNETYRISAVRDITQKKIAAKKLVESQNSLFYKVLEAEEKERIRIASELHDGIAPDLYSLKLHINAIENASSLEDAQSIIEKSYRIIDNSSKNLKAISKALSPYLLNDFGLDAAIKNYLEDISISETEVRYNSNINKTRFYTEIEVSSFRIITELINNSLKHSNANKIDIDLNLDNEKLVLNYRDNGKGFNVNDTLNNSTPSSSFGLKNIISRVKTMKGEISIQSEIGQGLKINFVLPIIQFKPITYTNK
jgi:PAS domain S-box-containing protein